jgi:hypothetical protein
MVAFEKKKNNIQTSPPRSRIDEGIGKLGEDQLQTLTSKLEELKEIKVLNPTESTSPSEIKRSDEAIPIVAVEEKDGNLPLDVKKSLSEPIPIQNQPLPANYDILSPPERALSPSKELDVISTGVRNFDFVCLFSLL